MGRGRRGVLGAALAVAAALVAIAGAACGGPAAPSPSPSPSARSDAVVARVDGEPITQAEIAAIRAELRLAGADDDQQAARAQALRRLLVRREAERRGLRVTDEAVDARRAQLEESMGGAAALAAALETAAMTDVQLAAALRYDLLEKAVAAALFPQRRATADQITAFYRRNREQLFTTPAQLRLRRLTVPSEALARRIAAEVAAGDSSFAAAARHYSMDNETRYDGGLLGWVSVATLPAEVRGPLAALAPGEVSAPVRSLGRWHLFEVLGRRPAHVVPLAEARAAVRAELTRRRQTAALATWIRAELARTQVTDGP